jgi:hypothetical protein
MSSVSLRSLEGAAGPFLRGLKAPEMRCLFFLRCVLGFFGGILESV